MTGRAWNNQGGSNRDGFNFKPYKPKRKQNVPPFDELKESQITSFKIAKPRRPQPNYGEFGDAIWIYEFYDDGLTTIDEDLSIDEDITPREPNEDIRDTFISDTNPENASTNIFPYAIEDEYELVVKYPGGLVLVISSGQSYSARNAINDPKFDLSLAIKSSVPISIGNNSESNLNIVKLLNSAQNPIFSLYNWLITKISIATDYSARQPDPILSAIQFRPDTIQLPSTQFVANTFLCGLFYAEGLQPNQICLNATNTVLYFEPTSQQNDDYRFWQVTYAGEILPLCLTLNQLPRVSIIFAPSSLREIEAGSGNLFVIRVTIDLVQPDSIDVPIRLGGDADRDFYRTSGISSAGIGDFFVTISAVTLFSEITIEPLANPSQTDRKTIELELLENSTVYELGTNIVSPVILPRIVIPLVSIEFAFFSSNEIIAGEGSFYLLLARVGDFNTGFSINEDLVVDIDLSGTADFDEYVVNESGIFANFLNITIPANESSVYIQVRPTTDTIYEENRTIVATITERTRYAIDPAKENVLMTILPPATPILSVTSSSAFVEIARAVFTIKFELTRPVAGNLTIISNLTGTLGLTLFTLTNGTRSGSQLSVVIPDGQTFVDVQLIPLNRRILDPEELIITIDPASIPAPISIDSTKSSTVLIIQPSPIVAKIKYFPTSLTQDSIVKNDRLQAPNDVLSPLVYTSNSDYTNLNITLIDFNAQRNSPNKITYNFNLNLNPVIGTFYDYLQDFNLNPTFNRYGDYLNFDLAALARIAIGRNSRYVYICGRLIAPTLASYTQIYASVSCELSDRRSNFTNVNPSDSIRYSTKYATLSDEVVSARIGYIDLDIRGVVNRSSGGVNPVIERSYITGYILKLDVTNGMSVSFVNPVVEARDSTYPGLYITDRTTQVVSI